MNEYELKKVGFDIWFWEEGERSVLIKHIV